MMKVTDLPGEAIAVQVWNEIVLIPKSVELPVIHRLSDVPRYGGKIVRQGFFDM
jgi:hypothetical protein